MGQKIQSQWDDDARTVIRTTYHPYWSWEELHEHEENVITPMMSSDKPLSLIVDMRAGTFFDPIGTTAQVRQTGEMHRALPIELVVFVLRDDGVGKLMQILHERYGAPNQVYRLARNLDEARAIIREHRGQLRHSA